MSEENANIEQAENGLLYKYNREMFYHFDREKGYTREIDYQISENQTIIKQSWDAAEQRLEGVRQRIIAGRLSPIAYYMEKALMEVPILAAYMEMSKWRIRWHLTPKGFKNLKPEILEKYASVFGIPVEEMKHPNF
ncbi:MAG: hypothetical protein M0Q38_14630 [Bacteroidales bacterium]|jgi:hypothetical protein|nr:hypothetical protein [Bacteroidales bacterium]